MFQEYLDFPTNTPHSKGWPSKCFASFLFATTHSLPSVGWVTAQIPRRLMRGSPVQTGWRAVVPAAPSTQAQGKGMLLITSLKRNRENQRCCFLHFKYTLASVKQLEFTSFVCLLERGRKPPEWTALNQHVPDGEILYIFISLLLIAWSKEASCTGSNGNSLDSWKRRAEPILSYYSPERKSNKASHLGFVTELGLTDLSTISPWQRKLSCIISASHKSNP